MGSVRLPRTQPPSPRVRGEGRTAMRNYKLGAVRGRFHQLRLVEAPPHPALLPARGEKE